MKSEYCRIARFKVAKLASAGARLPKLRLAARGRTSARQSPAACTVAAITAMPATRETRPIESSHGDAWQLYLREIGKVKLLTPQEEIALAGRIKCGDTSAREQMIKANLRLVVKIAREYDGLGLPLLDLINEGNIGLIKGVDRFDPKKGAKLSTYASWWIKQAMMQALVDQSNAIRLPVHVVGQLRHIRRAEARLYETLGREPTDEEVAHDVELDVRRVRQYREASRTPVSLDSPLGDRDSVPILDMVADADAVTPFEYLASNTDRELVREVLTVLTSRENKILGLRFGLDGSEPKTLNECAKFFGVTRERVRQIQEQALRKLRRLIKRREEPIIPAMVIRANTPKTVGAARAPLTLR